MLILRENLIEVL